ncbi:DUF6480 family protein [Streptomyces sp. NPDC007861]|uniref:DUF6480 family protein n=1 Tax=Streptomyces sp. NPDC007861 TaxID=3154893 RepID=UPI0033F2E525
MTTNNSEPDPRVSPGPPPDSLVPPGETPPAEASAASGAGPYQAPTRGWSKAPMAAIIMLAVLIAAFFLAYAVVLMV